MRTKIQKIPALRGGLRFDIQANQLKDFEMSNGQNIIFEEGIIKQKNGYSSQGETLDSDILDIDTFNLLSGTSHLMISTEDHIYRWDSVNSRYIPITIRSIVNDCESGWSAQSGDTVTHDTDSVVGTNSMKIVLVAERSDGDFLASEDSVTTANISAHTGLGFWFKSSIALAANALEVVYSEDNIATGPISGVEGTDYVIGLTPAITADTWTFVSVPKTLTNMDVLVNVSLYANATLASGAIFYLDDVSAFTLMTNTDSTYPSTTSMLKSDETEKRWIYVNGIDGIQTWDGTAIEMVNLGISTPTGFQAKLATEFKNHLMTAITTEAGTTYQQRVRWSDTGDFTNFGSGNASFFDLGGSDFISALQVFRNDYLVVFKEDSIWLVRATGDTDVFDPDQRIRGIGSPAGRTVAEIGTNLIFLSNDDVYLFDGVDVKPAGARQGRETSPIRNALFSQMNQPQIARSFGIKVEEFKEYWLFVPGPSSTYCNIAWVFDYDLETWTKFTLNDDMQSAGTHTTETTLTIGDLVGSIGSLNFRFGDRTLGASAPNILLGAQNANVYKYSDVTNDEDGSAVDAYFDTKDFEFGDLASHARASGIDVYKNGDTLKVWYSIDKGLNWVLMGTLVAGSNFTLQQLKHRIPSSQQVRFRFQNDVLTERFDFRDAGVYWQQGGNRL
jgi:hypothetical protein